MLKIGYMQLLLSIFLLFPALTLGQEAILRLAPYTVSLQFLNDQLAADTVANGGSIPPNRVYVLSRGGLYLQKAVFQVRAGQTIRMRSNDSAGVRRPVIMLYPTGLSPNPQNPPGNMIDLRGNLDFKNLIITGYFEAVDTNLNNLQGGLINVPVAGAGANMKFDGCVLTNSNGNHIRTDGATNLTTVTNCVFANMGYLGRSNLGAGKAIDLRDATADTVVMLNNTFVNWQDRVIRHYNFANPQAGTGPINYLRFEHNTLVNGMSYHGLLSLGSMGPRAIIANNLFVDAFGLGNDSDATRQAEFVNNLENDPFGGPRMAWIFTTPNDTTRWSIHHNYWTVSPTGQSFLDSASILPIIANPPLTTGAKLTYHINRRLGSDSTSAFTQIASLPLTKAPQFMKRLCQWYRSPAGGNKTKNTPNPAIWNSSYDFNRMGWIYLSDTLNGGFSTGSAAYTGAAGGYPVGDLNWFPSRYAAWLLDPISGIIGNAGLPEEFRLDQNYPNPFNPATKISFNLGKAGFTTLSVYNILGQKVATLAAGQMDVGFHEVDFNVTNLGTGVYFYRLVSGSNVDVKKMMVLK